MDSIDTIVTATFEISRFMRQRMIGMSKKSAKKGDERMNFLQVHSLIVIDSHEGITMKEFAEALMVTSPTATSFVNRLVKLQWVKRVPDPKNRKLVRLKITPAGRLHVKNKMKQHKSHMRSLFRLLPASDRDTLARIMKALQAILLSSSSL